jgi:hypothetical protein
VGILVADTKLLPALVALPGLLVELVALLLLSEVGRKMENQVSSYLNSKILTIHKVHDVESTYSRT